MSQPPSVGNPSTARFALPINPKSDGLMTCDLFALVLCVFIKNARPENKGQRLKMKSH